MFMAKLCYIQASFGTMKGIWRYRSLGFIHCFVLFNNEMYFFESELLPTEYIEADLLFQNLHAAVRSVCGPARRVLLHHHDAHLLPLHGKLWQWPNMARSLCNCQFRVKLFNILQVYQSDGLRQNISLGVGK